jgi:DNA-binding transcriptional ArsR family regulator
MVNHDARLNRVFGALTHPTRRAILRQLEKSGPASVSELAAPAALKLPAVMKHLDVLHEARLITRAKTGRTMFVRLAPEPMSAAMAWLARYQRFWSGGLERLAEHAEREERRLRVPKP